MAEDETEKEVDPTEFLRSLLRVKPEDAAKARQRARDAMRPRSDKKAPKDS